MKINIIAEICDILDPSIFQLQRTLIPYFATGCEVRLTSHTTGSFREKDPSPVFQGVDIVIPPKHLPNRQNIYMYLQR